MPPIKWVPHFCLSLFVLMTFCSLSARSEEARPETTPPAGRLSFARDVRPILSNHCFKCHGQDERERQASLRLDEQDASRAMLESGVAAIVPGHPESSELIRRIQSTDPDEMMPPTGSLRQLTASDKEILLRWIREGAEYQSHWSFIPPRRPALPAIPAVAADSLPRQAIDAFVLARLAQEKLTPASPANRETMLRRVTLDLTGLPPTPAELSAFRADESPDAYDRVVDRLLQSPRLGERLALVWLDVARYADTNGYNNDEERIMWRWRDWVIDAFNRNLPYDQFIVEQLAGDQLPNPTLAQRIATGFNRNHVLTTEGGIIDEEYRVEYVADRVQTTAAVFMGLTLQCARCHDHKYDPISQRDYFQLFAFFNHGPDRVLGYNAGAPATPYIKAPTETQQRELAALDSSKQDLQQRLEQRAAQIDDALIAWERNLSPEAKAALGPLGFAWYLPLDEGQGTEVKGRTFGAAVTAAPIVGKLQGPEKWLEGQRGRALEFDGQNYVDVGQVATFDRTDKISFLAWIYLASNEAVTVYSKMHDSAAYRGYDLIIEGGKPAVHLIHHWPENGLKVVAKEPISQNVWHHVAVTYDGSSQASGVKLYVDGQLKPLDVSQDKLSDTIVTDHPFHLGRRGEGSGFRGRIDEVQYYQRELPASDVLALFEGRAVAGIAETVAIPAAERTAEQRELIRRYFLDVVDEPTRMLRSELATVDQQRTSLDKVIPTALVMEDLAEPRKTFVLRRGQYDQPADEVTSSVPGALLPLPEGAPRNRLGLAQWLVSPDHPLTARVAVNRWWSLLFGTGLVETEEDFGAQGVYPSNPQLLDWLACEYQRLGWDTKALLRLIVTSAAYRQSSHLPREMRERDPHNRLLARGPRFRLPAETVRDQALAVSGLLVERQGGPSVKPYQPAGLWEDVTVERRFTYEPDRGAGLYRRSLYTYWKRTCPPPGMTTWDAPDREFCVLRRARTNTPLQALLLMNEPTYLEAARQLAQRLMAAHEDFTSRAEFAYQVLLARNPRPDEVEILRSVYESAQARFVASPASAQQFLAHGDSPRDDRFDPVELAAWSTVMNLLLSLDETLTKG